MAFSQLRLSLIGLATDNYRYAWSDANDGTFPGNFTGDSYWDDAVGPSAGSTMTVVGQGGSPVVHGVFYESGGVKYFTQSVYAGA